ncbi:Smr/MutS family protein [Pelagibacteraceae bacterium]|nr:Smr/MutS family protein [Pelagibacteraceae bacterium]
MIKKKNLSIEDKKVWENFTKHPSDIYDKEKNNTSFNFAKERFKYDLHGFSLIDANQKVKKIILSCVENKFKEILLITGKGLHSTTKDDAYVSKDLSRLKFSVPDFINNNNELNKYVLSISEASIKDGGAGAILIKLKNL